MLNSIDGSDVEEVLAFTETNRSAHTLSRGLHVRDVPLDQMQVDKSEIYLKSVLKQSN